MFPLGAVRRVFGKNNPAGLILLITADLPVTGVDHGFDGEGHTGNKQHAGAFLTVVLHIGLFVELKAYTVTPEVTDNCTAVLMGIVGDGIAQVTYENVGLGADLLAYLP